MSRPAQFAPMSLPYIVAIVFTEEVVAPFMCAVKSNAKQNLSSIESCSLSVKENLISGDYQEESVDWSSPEVCETLWLKPQAVLKRSEVELDQSACMEHRQQKHSGSQKATEAYPFVQSWSFVCCSPWYPAVKQGICRHLRRKISSEADLSPASRSDHVYLPFNRTLSG